VVLFPFQEGLVSELFWWRHEAAISGLLFGVEKGFEPQPVARAEATRKSTEPPAFLYPVSNHRCDEDVKDRTEELVACPLELESPNMM
jgi:hypothetical protein